jgi:hypothetical protein
MWERLWGLDQLELPVGSGTEAPRGTEEPVGGAPQADWAGACSGWGWDVSPGVWVVQAGQVGELSHRAEAGEGAGAKPSRHPGRSGPAPGAPGGGAWA